MSRSEGPADWVHVSLANVCWCRTENLHPASVQDDRYVGLEHMDSGQPRLTRFGSARQVTSNKSRFRRGDVLYGKLRPYLDKAVLADFDGICSTDILVFRPNDKITAEFLAHLLHTTDFIELAVRTTAGVNHPRTSWWAVSEFGFRVPPHREQHAIVQALRAVQDALGARARELTVERERKAALMEDLFAHGSRREASRVTGIGLLPQSWELARYDALFDLQQGKQVAQRFRGGESPTPFLRTINVLWGRVDISSLDDMDFTPDEVHRLCLRPNDLLVCEGGEIGRAAVWNGECAVCCHQNHVHRLRAGAGIAAEPRFFMYWMQVAFLYRGCYRGRSNDTTIPNLSASRLRAFIVPLPPLDEQREIAAVLSACDGKIAALETEAALLDELFRALLEDLMAGRLSAQALIEE